MRTLASLITAGPLAPEKAIRLVSAACRAYARTNRPFDIEREQIVVTADAAFIRIRQGLRSIIHSSLQFHRTRVRNAILRLTYPRRRVPYVVTPQDPNGPIIIVTRDTISMANPVGTRNVAAFGTMLWELLAGRRLADILREGLPPLPQVSPELHIILREAISYDIADHRTPADFADALDDYLASAGARSS